MSKSNFFTRLQNVALKPHPNHHVLSDYLGKKDVLYELLYNYDIINGNCFFAGLNKQHFILCSCYNH